MTRFRSRLLLHTRRQRNCRRVPQLAAAAMVKRVLLLKQAAATLIVSEECEDLRASSKQYVCGEEQASSNGNVMCGLCFCGENEGSERSRKMLPCNTCDKQYHRSCLKSWSKNRDLFHWSSWSCPSCRTCEVCRKTGDPNKFMFCKRCDGSYHCYCQQPPHKNVGHGPYLCPKHTKCHSCDSSVPGNGLSVRWFLGYTCCDACGRLFVKGNYCPVCLKVYRDSEATPMVCCDTCERWVHCPCDGISDTKYMQYQADGNLQYICPTCRGECCQVRNLEEAVQELWKKRDEADEDLIAKLRKAAGLPTKEEIFEISPFSDDEENTSIPKIEYARSLKFSLKGVDDKSPKKTKEYGKKSSSKKKKGNEISTMSRTDGRNDEMQFSQISDEPVNVSPAAFIETNGTKTSRTIKIKSSKSHNLIDIGSNSSMPKVTHGPKLVIHLAGRTRNTDIPPRIESPSVMNGRDLISSDGHNRTDQVKGSKIKFKKPNSEIYNISSKLIGREFTDEDESFSPTNDDNSSIRRPYLKFKIPKNSNNGIQNVFSSNLSTANQDPLPLAGKAEITYTRGHRSKRKILESEDECNNPMKELSHPSCEDKNPTKDFTDAN